MLAYFGVSILLGSIIISEMRQAKINPLMAYNLICTQAIVKAVANKIDPVSHPDFSWSHKAFFIS